MKQKSKGQTVLKEHTLQYSSKKEYLLYRLALDSLEDTPGRKGIVVTYPIRMPSGVEDGGCIRVDVPEEQLQFVRILHDYMRTLWNYNKDYSFVMRETKRWIKENDLS